MEGRECGIAIFGGTSLLFYARKNEAFWGCYLFCLRQILAHFFAAAFVISFPCLRAFPPFPSLHCMLFSLLFSAFSVPFPVCPLFFAPLVSRCSVSLARPSLLLHIRLAAEGDRGWVMEGGERGGWVGTAEKACGRERHRSTQAQLAETRSYA